MLRAVTAAPSSVLVTIIGEGGVDGRIESTDGAEARFESEVSFSDESTFREEGAIDFGSGHSLRFRTVGAGQLGPSIDPNLKHGAVVWEVDGGEGRFDGAQGLITSNFFVGDTGEVTDNHFGFVFVADPRVVS